MRPTSTLLSASPGPVASFGESGAEVSVANGGGAERIRVRGDAAASISGWRSIASMRLLVVAVGILIALPVIVHGFPPRGHDAMAHELWYGCFSRQLAEGEPYPRWLADMNDGFGSPAFFYYPPAPYYFASALGVLIPGVEPLRELGLAAALAVVASGLAAFEWLRRSSSALAAALAAILYMGMPYHLKVDLYTRGALAELWAFVWMPLVLLFARRCADSGKLAAGGLAASYAALILTHLPTTLLFSPLPLVQALCLSRSGARLASLRRVGASMALGIGLSAIYLVPAMTTQGWVHIEALKHPPADIASNMFLRSAGSPFRDDFTVGLFWVALQMLVLCACCLALVRRFRPDTDARREGSFWFLVALFAVGMMFPLSTFVYDVFAPLKSIQFPWRFHTVLCVALAAGVALAVPSIRRPFPRAKLLLLTAGALIIGFWIPTGFRNARAKLRDPPRAFAERGAEWRRHRWCVPEYRPIWVKRDLRELAAKFADSGSPSKRSRVVEGRAVVSVVGWRPRDIELAIDAETAATVQVAQLYYPGWTTRAGGSAPLVTRPSADTGLVELVIPSGRHVVTLRLESSAAERWGLYATLASLAALVIVLRPRARRTDLADPLDGRDVTGGTVAPSP